MHSPGGWRPLVPLIDGVRVVGPLRRGLQRFQRWKNLWLRGDGRSATSRGRRLVRSVETLRGRVPTALQRLIDGRLGGGVGAARLI
jgi:hypothetical protein